MVELIGSVACLLLSICGLPQVIKTWRTKSVKDLSWGFLLIWFTGDILMGIYVLFNIQWPLLINYIVNGILVGYLLFAKIKYKSL